MNYSEIEQTTYDYDIFLYDEEKLIHIATAGMKFINSLNQISFNLIQNFRIVTRYGRILNIEINPEIGRENVTDMEIYMTHFKHMAKKGFYSYDKVNIDDAEDLMFQLVSWPFYDRKIILPSGDILINSLSQKSWTYKNNFIKAKKNFPTNNAPFNIESYI